MSSFERQTIDRLSTENAALRKGIHEQAARQHTLEGMLGLACAFRILGDIYVEARKAPDGVEGYWWAVRRKAEVLGLRGSWEREVKDECRTNEFRELFYHQTLEAAIQAAGEAAKRAYRLPDFNAPAPDDAAVAMGDRIAAIVSMHGAVSLQAIADALGVSPHDPLAGSDNLVGFIATHMLDRVRTALVDGLPAVRWISDEERAENLKGAERLKAAMATVDELGDGATVEDAMQTLLGQLQDPIGVGPYLGDGAPIACDACERVFEADEMVRGVRDERTGASGVFCDGTCAANGGFGEPTLEHEAIVGMDVSDTGDTIHLVVVSREVRGGTVVVASRVVLPGEDVEAIATELLAAHPGCVTETRTVLGPDPSCVTETRAIPGMVPTPEAIATEG